MRPAGIRKLERAGKEQAGKPGKGMVADMPVAIEYREESLRAALSGEIDHHSAKELRMQIDDAISRAVPQKLIMDFSAVTFMDSSGIGLIMGRYKQMAVYGGTLVISGLGPQQRTVMRLAGLDRLCFFEQAEETAEK